MKLCLALQLLRVVYDIVCNRDKLTSIPIKRDTSPISIKISNDIISDTLSYQFTTNTTGTVSCTFNKSFDTFNSKNDYQILTMSTHQPIYFEKFDITTDCQVPVSYTNGMCCSYVLLQQLTNINTFIQQINLQGTI